MTSANGLTKVVTDAAISLLFSAMRKTFPCQPLSTIAYIHNGQGLKAEDREQYGEEDVFGSGGWVGRHTKSLNPGPFVVIGRKGSAGKATFAPRGGWATDTAYFATPLKVEELHCKFLFYTIKSLDFSGDVISTAIPGINRTAIYSYLVPVPPPTIQLAVVAFLDAVSDTPRESSLPPLPPPLTEQRQVVARIEELTGKVEEARELRRQAVEEADALVNAQLRATAESLAKRYGATQLENLITEAGYGTSEKCSTERGQGEVPVLRIPNVVSERIELDDLKFARLSVRDRERLFLVDGDILVVRTNGSVELVGRSAVVDALPEPMAFASYIIRLRLDRATILPAYAQHMLRHLRMSGQLIDFARTTAGQYNVSLGRLRSAEIPVPSIQEQRRVVAQLDDLQQKTDALKAVQAETAAELDALMPSILDKAFRGEL